MRNRDLESESSTAGRAHRPARHLGLHRPTSRPSNGGGPPASHRPPPTRYRHLPTPADALPIREQSQSVFAPSAFYPSRLLDVARGQGWRKLRVGEDHVVRRDPQDRALSPRLNLCSAASGGPACPSLDAALMPASPRRTTHAWRPRSLPARSRLWERQRLQGRPSLCRLPDGRQEPRLRQGLRIRHWRPSSRSSSAGSASASASRRSLRYRAGPSCARASTSSSPHPPALERRSPLFCPASMSSSGRRPRARSPTRPASSTSRRSRPWATTSRRTSSPRSGSSRRWPPPRA